LDNNGQLAKSKAVGFSAPNCYRESIVHPVPEDADTEPELVGLHNTGRSSSGGYIEHDINGANLKKEYEDPPLIEA
jgi:hypothetical protein